MLKVRNSIIQFFHLEPYRSSKGIAICHFLLWKKIYFFYWHEEVSSGIHTLLEL